MPEKFLQNNLKEMSRRLPIHFEQEGAAPNIVAEIRISRFADVEGFSYKSNVMLPWKKKKEKDNLIEQINQLIRGFNDLNEYLIYDCIADNAPNNPYRLTTVKEKALRDNKLEIHQGYLLKFMLYEEQKTIVALLQRLAYNRTKEFEKFIKGLSGKKANLILSEIQEFKRNKFVIWKRDVEDAIESSYDFLLKQIIKKYLKPKQESRKKQLLKKFKAWQEKLSNPKNPKQQVFAGVVNSLVELFGTKPHNLSQFEIEILKDCFGKKRGWSYAWEGDMKSTYNPFPGLDEKTNRLAIAMYGIITEGNDNKIDLAIEEYLKRPLSGAKIPRNKRKHRKSSQ